MTKKTSSSWQERLGDISRPAQPTETTNELADAVARALAAERRCALLEIHAKKLERELCLARVKILDFEIRALEP